MVICGDLLQLDEVVSSDVEKAPTSLTFEANSAIEVVICSHDSYHPD